MLCTGFEMRAIRRQQVSCCNVPSAARATKMGAIHQDKPQLPAERDVQEIGLPSGIGAETAREPTFIRCDWTRLPNVDLTFHE